jgi:hypothetical protein
MIELDPPAFVDAAARAGFAAVSLMVAFPVSRGPGFPMLGDTAMRRETKRRLDDTGLVRPDRRRLRGPGDGLAPAPAGRITVSTRE